LSCSTAALAINMASVSSDVPVVLRVKRKRTEDPADALGEPLVFIDCKERSRGSACIVTFTIDPPASELGWSQAVKALSRCLYYWIACSWHQNQAKCRVKVDLGP